MTFTKFFEKASLFILRKIKELVLTSFFKLKYILSGGSICPGIKDFPEFLVRKKEIYKKERKDGVSGFYRVKTEEQLLEKSVLSHLPYLDEIIIVHNDCSDKTPEIAKKLAQKYPEKIKVYEYKPKVFPALSHKHVVTCASSPHSLANYYNFALSKTNYKIAVKIDADHLAIQDRFAQAVEKIRKEGIDTLMYFYGVNVYKSKKGDRWLVNKRNPFTAGSDCGFFPVKKGVYFTQRLDSEALHIPILWHMSKFSIGVLFYHIKAIKPDKGTSVFEKDEFAKRKKDKIKDVLNNPELVEFSQIDDEKIQGINNECVI